MTKTITDTITFVTMRCPVAGCGVVYALEERYQTERQRDSASWCCPNGHSLSYRGANETENERLRRDLAAAKGNARWAQDRLESEKRSHAATKGQLTKTRKRIQHGVCPHCNRTFADVARHMATKHPDPQH